MLGERHPDVATLLNNLAYLHYEKGDIGKALALGRDVLDMRREVLGELHPEVAQSLNAIAMWHMEDGALETAETLLREAVEINTEVHGDDHPDVADSLTLLASCLVAQERFDEAYEQAGAARRMYAAALPDGHWLTAVAASTEGAALTGLKRYAEAEAAGERLVSLYKVWGKPEKAAEIIAMVRE